MKKTALCLFTLLFSVTLDAAVKKDSVFINTELTVGAEKLSPLMLTKNGEKASVESDSIRLEVIPALQKDGSVLLKAKVFRFESGTAKLISAPQVLTRFGEKAMIITEAEDGTKVNMKMVASLEE